MTAGDIVLASSVLLLLFARQADAQDGGLTCWSGESPFLPCPERFCTGPGPVAQTPTNLTRVTDWSWVSCVITTYSHSSNFYDDNAEWEGREEFGGTWRTCPEELRYWEKLNDEYQNIPASRAVRYCCNSNECNHKVGGSGPPMPSRTPPGTRSSPNFSLLTQPTLAIFLMCLVVARLMIMI